MPQEYDIQEAAFRMPLTATRARKILNAQSRDRRVERMLLEEEHGELPRGMEWVQEGGRWVSRPIKLGRPPLPKTDAQIRKIARELYVVGTDDVGVPNRWATKDHTVLVHKLPSEYAQGKFFYRIGAPGRDESGNLMFSQIGEVYAQVEQFRHVKHAIEFKAPAVDALSLRGHATIDPAGTKFREATQEDYERALAAGDITIGD